MVFYCFGEFTMRTELIDNDINLFLSQEPDEFLKVIKKRIKTWRTATDYNSIDFLGLILVNVSQKTSQIPVETIWQDIFLKLDSIDFDFQPSHYVPNFNLGTPYNPNMCVHYKAMLHELMNRNIVFDTSMAQHFVEQQLDGIEDSVAVFLESVHPVFGDIVSRQQVKIEIKGLVSDLYEMMLLENPSKKTQIESNAINLMVNSFIPYGGQSVQSGVSNYLDKQSKKIDFILAYINEATLSKDEAKELLLSFRPSGEVVNNLDRIYNKKSGTHWFAYMAAFQNGSLLSRHYFTKQQIELMDKIQDKFNVQLLEPVND